MHLGTQHTNFMGPSISALPRYSNIASNIPFDAKTRESPITVDIMCRADNRPAFGYPLRYLTLSEL